MSQLVITAVGPDRPGIVGEITSHLHQSGANLLDSRMVNLRGQFSLMILLEINDDNAGKLARELPATGRSMGLTLSITPQTAPAERATGLAYRLKTYSSDQPGIVARLTGLLRSFGINIEELAAWQESAAFAGSLIFLCEIKMTIPPTVAISALRADLSKLCNELNCDVDLEPLT